MVKGRAVSKKVNSNEDIIRFDIKNDSNKVSEFFNHLIAYGGFYMSEGVLKIWGDYSVFIPVDAFITLIHELEVSLGEKDTHDLFYWLGRMNGRNATEMLIERFGANKKDISMFVNGATQDGMGYLRIQEYDKSFTYGIVVGTNSILAKEYKKKYGQTKFSVDFYLKGILAGGTEPLVDKFVNATEKECIASGSSKCIYCLTMLKDRPKFPFFNKLSFTEEEISKKTRLLMLKRKSCFKLFGKKDIQFGDGSFTINKIQGIDLMNYGKIILDEILKQKLKSKKQMVNDLFVDACIASLGNKLKTNDLKALLKEIEIFGYGKFEIKFSGAKKILISNTSNPYSLDYLEIFGKSKESVDDFIVLLLKKIFELNGKKVKVREVQCMAKRDKCCEFEISFL